MNVNGVNMDLKELLKKVWNNIFLIPEARFDGLTKDKNYKESFIYLLACMIISLPIFWIATILLITDPSGDITLAGKIISAFTGSIVYIVLGIPLTYIGIGICHLLLKLLGGKADFLKTVQVFIYGETTSVILGNIPFFGWIFSLVALANITLGAKRIHKISLLRAIVAVIVIPVIIAMVLGLALVAYLVSTSSVVIPTAFTLS